MATRLLMVTVSALTVCRETCECHKCGTSADWLTVNTLAANHFIATMLVVGQEGQLLYKSNGLLFWKLAEREAAVEQKN